MYVVKSPGLLGRKDVPRERLSGFSLPTSCNPVTALGSRMPTDSAIQEIEVGTYYCSRAPSVHTNESKPQSKPLVLIYNPGRSLGISTEDEHVLHCRSIRNSVRLIQFLGLVREKVKFSSTKNFSTPHAMLASDPRVYPDFLARGSAHTDAHHMT